MKNIRLKECDAMKTFIKIDGIGELKIDRIFFESYYPILFTCSNEKEELFLCVCCQANADGKKWLITKTDGETIVCILKNEITVRKAFLKYPQLQITVFDDNSNDLSIIRGDDKDWNNDTSEALPEKGEYLDAEDGEFAEEIAYYKAKEKISYGAVCVDMQVGDCLIEPCENYDEYVVLNAYYTELNNIDIYKKIVSREIDVAVEKVIKHKIRYDEKAEMLSEKKLTENFIAHANTYLGKDADEWLAAA